MRVKLDDVLSDEERLDLWAEMMALSVAMQEYCDWWWQLDPPMRKANDRRGAQPTKNHRPKKIPQ